MAIKLLVQVKGGVGSGNWGHTGRPGLIGGSGGSGGGRYSNLPTEHRLNAIDSEKVIRALDEDRHEDMWQIARGLGADGTFPGMLNITSSLDSSDAVGNSWIDPDSEDSFSNLYSDGKASADVVGILDTLERWTQDSKRSRGWNVNTSTPAQRAKWEKFHYKRTFGGNFEHAETWALVQFEQFIIDITGKSSTMLPEFERQLAEFE